MLQLIAWSGMYIGRRAVALAAALAMHAIGADLGRVSRVSKRLCNIGMTCSDLAAEVRIAVAPRVVEGGA